MKRIIKRVWNYFLYYFSGFIGNFIPIKNNRILCWSYSGKQFSCNPAYITKYIIENHKDEYEIIWMFIKGKDTTNIPKGVKIVRYGTIRHLVALNSAKFIITNSRTDYVWSLWHKKSKQKYIMTWHSSMGIKKVELDADWNFQDYIDMAKKDSERCDLILSGSKFRTEVIKRAFQYNGEILEAGTPRNDIFFKTNNASTIRKKIFQLYDIPTDKKVVLYAPTFRKKTSLDYYKINWTFIKKSLNEKFNSDFFLLIRLHPNLIGKDIDLISFYKSDDIKNVTNYDDMQELLVISDILITDYSSSMFDFALTKRPCYIYANDTKEYERGTYFNIESLPFLFAQKESKLIENIDNFDYEAYVLSLNHFVNNVIFSYEHGHACECFYEWIKKQK